MDGRGKLSFERQQGAAPVVTISVPARVAYNLDAMQDVVKKVAGILGCDGCHSGFDFRFRHVLDFIVNQEGEIFAGGLEERIG
jgi:hypothetical protein